MLFDSGFVSSVWTAFLKTLCYNKKKGGISMLEQLRAEWEKLFGHKYTSSSEKQQTVDGETSHRLSDEDPETLHEMMGTDWNTFLDGSDIFTELSAEEQEEIRRNGPRHEDYI
ncbi:predicted protein [Enterococcus gallinarum EG2]|jgi:hypothetical protein|nr:predicted protein [Enterococcus gallinarum EG2]OJG43257.1 hypothetical protein RV03_GL003125 [Enterococcus gallinarum]